MIPKFEELEKIATSGAGVIECAKFCNMERQTLMQWRVKGLPKAELKRDFFVKKLCEFGNKNGVEITMEQLRKASIEFSKNRREERQVKNARIVNPEHSIGASRG